MAAVLAIYVAQAAFWFWLAWEAKRDRPKGADKDDRSLAVWLWRYDASVVRWFAWTMLVGSTVVLIVALAAARG